jgi:glycosyltransferase involved in cell wall biosynthesis
MVTPYRVPLIESLARKLDVHVFFSGHEGNRPEWRGVEDEVRAARVKRAWGVTIPYLRHEGGAASGPAFLHVTPGFFADLVRSRPDAIISTEMGYRTLMALLYGALHRRPVWVWWGGTRHTERSVGRLRSLVRRLIARWARRWISYGKSSTEYLLTLGILRARVLEIQNCVDERLFGSPVEPAFDLPIKPVLLHAGQLIPRKGIGLLLDAAKAVQDEGARFSLLLVGSGPERDALQAQVSRLGLRDVHFVPGVPAASMPAVYRSADVFVFPTLHDVWGLVANEAMLAGLPVMCSVYAGCAGELFPPASTFDPLNPDEFRKRLREAVRGSLPPPDRSRLRTTAEVATAIMQELDDALRPAPRANLIPVDQ